MLERFKKYLLPDSELWNRYANCFKRMEAPAKTVLLKEGAVSKKFFIVEKGCVRAWFNNDGKDITFQFFFENNTVASIESFRKNIPSMVTLETIEPTVLWWIHKKDADNLLEEIKSDTKLRDLFINAIFERTYDYMKHFFSFIKETPKERYRKLIKERPQLIQRVPQHYIASYLGITTVHLSRIKSQLMKAK